MTRSGWIIASSTAALYLAIIAGGLHITTLDLSGVPVNASTAWQPPSPDSIPPGLLGQSIRTGKRIFDHTALYAPLYTSSRVSCGSCHAASGIQPGASPMVGLPALFPMYSRRAGRMISLSDRINECFVRSENGQPLPRHAPEMQALIDYIDWLSTPEPANHPFQGRGLALLPRLHPDPLHGSFVYAQQCAGCHGNDGQGISPLYPPLWGPDSFNDGAGMNDVHKMASFVESNMPQNRMGILSRQDAFDVSAFIHQQQRPHFNPAYRSY